MILSVRSEIHNALVIGKLAGYHMDQVTCLDSPLIVEKLNPRILDPSAFTSNRARGTSIPNLILSMSIVDLYCQRLSGVSFWTHTEWRCSDASERKGRRKRNQSRQKARECIFEKIQRNNPYLSIILAPPEIRRSEIRHAPSLTGA